MTRHEMVSGVRFHVDFDTLPAFESVNYFSSPSFSTHNFYFYLQVDTYDKYIQ